jgi:hypothetical protein
MQHVPLRRGANEFLTYQNVTEGKMTPWPDWFEEDENEEGEETDASEDDLHDLKAAAKDLVGQLTAHDPFERLGSEPGGAEEVRRHPFFAGIEVGLCRLNQVDS